LHQVFGVFQRTHEAVAVGLQFAAVRLGKLGKFALVALAGSGEAAGSIWIEVG
jgi:hypothetical protein